MEIAIFISIVFCITYFLLKYFIKVAPKFSLVDIPNKRSSHRKPMPRGGGIVFGFMFILSILIYNFNEFNEIKFTLLAILIVYIGGILDDIYNISSKQKILFILIASIIVYFDGYKITSIGNYLGYDIYLYYLSLPFTVFGIIAFTNAINLSDGLDGLATSLCIIILSAICIIGITFNDNDLIFWSLLLIGILLAFLILNWYPAKLFMGDSGSLFLGFVISILGIKILAYVNMMSILFIAAVPILDTLVVFRRRIQRSLSPFVADKNHIHHILTNMKKDKHFTVKTLIKIQFAFSLIFLQVYKQDDMINLITFMILFSIFFSLFDPRFRVRKSTSKKKTKRKTKDINEI